MSKISLEYNGGLRNNLTHEASKTNILTDAPKDNNGKGESFSPTDLVASALAACMVTIIGIQEESLSFGITKMSAEVEKIMESNPRRIAEVKIELNIDTNSQLSELQMKNIYAIAKNCPVALSLKKELKQSVKINFTH